MKVIKSKGPEIFDIELEKDLLAKNRSLTTGARIASMMFGISLPFKMFSMPLCMGPIQGDYSKGVTNKAIIETTLSCCFRPPIPFLTSEGVKKLGRSGKRRYLQSFRIAVFDGHRLQGSASEGK